MSESTGGRRFAELRFIGARFDDPGMPVDSLAELAAYRELLIDVARAVFLDRNPDRQRVPKNFAEGLDLRLVRVDSGSAVPVLERSSDSLFDLDDPFSEARDLVSDAVASVEGTIDFPATFPREALTQFNRFGKTLRGDEMIELHTPGSDRIPHYTPTVRKELVLRVSKSYKRDWILLGTVSDLADRGEFDIRQPNGKVIPATGTLDFFDGVKAALHPLGTGPQVRVEGVAVLDANDTVVSMESIRSFDLVGPPSDDYATAAADLEVIAQLTDGWLNGSGARMSTDAVDAARSVLNLFAVDEFPVPRIYPTVEGGVRFEWTINAADVALEVTAEGDLEMFVVGESSESDAHHDRITASDAVFLLRDLV